MSAAAECTARLEYGGDVDIDEELPLEGGNATQGVVRVGDTVRKPWEPTTSAVHELMRRLAAAGVEVPAPLGRDEQGRQILEFVPGTPALDAPPLTLDQLVRVGRLIRSVHDASEGFTPSTPTPWEPLLPVPGGATDLICHGDLTPWNLVLGERWVFIDWDGTAPSSRLWDLAYSAQAFTLNDVTEPPSTAARRLAALVDGYGADDGLRAALPRTMATRAEAMWAMLRTAHHEGRDPWGSMFTTGHGTHWRGVADHVGRHEDVWAEALGAPGRAD
ncbi:phosphotransferase [Brachybacterium sp.]|uniref:phosphotransferase n=1 Tax=Brachybacterium sp. TaxID=1891286 RepID=UPI002ED5E1C1